jgi:hypothetical protein
MSADIPDAQHTAEPNNREDRLVGQPAINLPMKGLPLLPLSLNKPHIIVGEMPCQPGKRPVVTSQGLCPPQAKGSLTVGGKWVPFHQYLGQSKGRGCVIFVCEVL